MRQIWSKFLSVFFIILGICLLLFVLRMVWFPPSSMGMMMGKSMMIHHLIHMFSQLFFLSFIAIVIIGIVWTFTNKGK